MTSTAGRKPFDLSQAARQSLHAHGFEQQSEGSVADGPAVFVHPWAPTMRLLVSMSPRTAHYVQWHFQQIPGHLSEVIPRPVLSGSVDEFEVAMAAVAAVASARYLLGPPIVDRVEEPGASSFA